MTRLKDSKRSREIQALVNDSDFFKDLVQNFLQQYLDTEITGFLGAAPYERFKQRKATGTAISPAC